MVLPSNRADEADTLARTVADRFAALPEVTAVAWAGSRNGFSSDAGSDVDLYVYATEPSPIENRAAIARAFGERREVDNRFWEPGDEWIDTATGLGVDVMHRSPGWIEDQLARVLDRYEASLGYSTCFWYNMLHSAPLYDRDGWFARLQASANQPYPEELRRNVVAKNHPVLRRTISSYLRQLDAALRRHDRVSVNHRITALLASYFDILFAVNRVPHPGEKRLVELATRLCPKVPVGLERDIADLLGAEAERDDGGDVLARANRLIDDLDGLLLNESLI